MTSSAKDKPAETTVTTEEAQEALGTLDTYVEELIAQLPESSTLAQAQAVDKIPKAVKDLRKLLAGLEG